MFVDRSFNFCAMSYCVVLLFLIFFVSFSFVLCFFLIV